MGMFRLTTPLSLAKTFEIPKACATQLAMARNKNDRVLWVSSGASPSLRLIQGVIVGNRHLGKVAFSFSNTAFWWWATTGDGLWLTSTGRAPCSAHAAKVLA